MIDAYRPGKMTIGKQEHRRDLKIVGGAVVPEWWRKDGHHLEAGDVEDILRDQPDTFVVGTGYAGNMRIDPALRSKLEEKNIELIAEDTHTATETFNRLHSQGRDVAGAFHLTC